MYKHFTTSWTNLREGRVWTVFTSNFSQEKPMHFLVNMFVLHSFGAPVVAAIGAPQFLGL